jgi:hypothetical protein
MQSNSAPRDAAQDLPVIGIRLADCNFTAVVHVERARLRRECPRRSDAEIDQTIFSAILGLLGDPAWEGVQ